jgi:hypothetical protein
MTERWVGQRVEVRLTFRSRERRYGRLEGCTVKGGNHVINFDAHDIQQRIKLAETERRAGDQEHKRNHCTIVYVPLSSLERATMYLQVPLARERYGVLSYVCIAVKMARNLLSIPIPSRTARRLVMCDVFLFFLS